MRALHILLKTTSHSGMEENINPFQLEPLLSRLIEGPHVRLKTISHSGIEVNVNPSGCWGLGGGGHSTTEALWIQLGVLCRALLPREQSETSREQSES